MRLAAVDGFLLDVPDNEANRRAFGGPKDSSGKPGGFPQARIVTLTEIGTHACIDARVGGYNSGERDPATAMAASAAGMLVIMDRGPLRILATLVAPCSSWPFSQVRRGLAPQSSSALVSLFRSLCPTCVQNASRRDRSGWVSRRSPSSGASLQLTRSGFTFKRADALSRALSWVAGLDASLSPRQRAAPGSGARFRCSVVCVELCDRPPVVGAAGIDHLDVARRLRRERGHLDRLARRYGSNLRPLTSIG